MIVYKHGTYTGDPPGHVPKHGHIWDDKGHHVASYPNTPEGVARVDALVNQANAAVAKESP